MTAPQPSLSVQQLTELEELLTKATPGPWVVHPSDLSEVVGAYKPAEDADDGWQGLDVCGARTHIPGTVYGDAEAEEANAALIAAGITALPTLLATIRRQQVDLTAKQAVIDAVTELHRPWHWGRDGSAVIGSFDPNPDGFTRCVCGWRGLWIDCPTASALASPDTAQEDPAACRCATLRPGDDCPAHPFDPSQYVRCRCSHGSNAAGPHTRGCPLHPEAGA